jgi:argininosuccinate lyase
MKTKLWEKEKKINPLIESFTIGKDPELDLFLAPYDVTASKAHAKMLAKVKLITEEEEKILLRGLDEIELLLKKEEFRIEAGVEDIHSQIELYLTSKYGEAGKKIHTARSRNDQVLTAIKLYLKDELNHIRKKSQELRNLFIQLAHENKGILLPGYTHFQAAMPSSFDMWLSAWAESIDDDLELLEAAYRICNKSPLGSAAGFGTSFPIDREFTSKEMGFAAVNKSSVYAQMTRGKSEKAVAIALSSIAHTVSKFSYDVCLYLCQNFNFISFPEELTTGSSIMPHKKNPDVFELLRARCNVIQSLPEQLTLLTNNLPSGYHRDMQLTKELIIPAVEQMKMCLHVLLEVLPSMKVNKNCIEDEKYKYIFSVEEVNKLVMQGIPFREAYHKVSESIANNSFVPNTNVNHTHLGSIGNV